MVLVDTSVWIRALSGAKSFRSHLDDLLSRDEVLGHDFVYGELLIGDRGGRTKLLAAYAEMHWARSVSHQEVVSLVQDRKLHGRGLGWIDVHLLASALVERAAFWTADAAVAGVAKSIGVTTGYPTS
jgi:predicted nucleic acid-binding protein